MKPVVSRTLRLGLTGLILVMLVLFARKVNWHDTWRTMQSASLPVLLGAALVNLASIVVKAVRWWVFLRPIGATSLPLALRATFAGAGLNNVLVANGGEAARVVFVARAAHVQSAKVLATLALERLFELVGYVILLSLAATFLQLPSSLERVKPFAITVLIAMLALLVWLLRRPDVVETTVGPKPASWRGRVKEYGARVIRTISQVSSGPRFIAAVALSVVAWALQVATYQLTAHSAHLPMTLVATIAALLAVNLGFALRATPGNVGVFQAAYAATAVAFGVDKDQAIAVAFLIQAQQILPVTLLGVALAPEFIFKQTKRRASDVPGEIPSASRSESPLPREPGR
ncbi:MAG: lysylphosphatidylglycerol synthase transmembrane domain-containing protein [Gemmatimonadaceae bacterium]